MPDRKPLSGLVVLVLEDDYHLAKDVSHALEEAGASVMGPYADAAEAVALADQDRPDCALVDVNLGRGPNFAPAKAFMGRGIPLIFLTAYDSAVIPAELARMTCLQKPVLTSEIIAAVEKACPR